MGCVVFLPEGDKRLRKFEKRPPVLNGNTKLQFKAKRHISLVPLHINCFNYFDNAHPYSLLYIYLFKFVIFNLPICVIFY